MKRKLSETSTKSIFVRRDARSALQNYPLQEIGALASAIITSPPYFGCRDYESHASSSAADEQKNLLGVNNATRSDSMELGREADPFTFARNLADVFGEAAQATQKYLQHNGSLIIVIGDTFARKNYTDSEKHYAPISKKSSIGIQHVFVNEMRKRGWRLWQEVIWSKTSAPPSGTVQLRCNPVHEYVLWFDASSADKPKWNKDAVREEGKTKAGTVMPPVGGKKYGEYKKTLVSDGKRARRDVIDMCPSRDKSAHVAPFPEELVRVWINGLTDEGDVVCDPFAGTRTTERVALQMKRRSVAFDLHNWKKSAE